MVALLSLLKITMKNMAQHKLRTARAPKSYENSQN